MDADDSRDSARIVVIGLVLVLVLFGAACVIYKINKRLIEPGEFRSTQAQDTKK